jgi:putative hydrolase of the HAD superfamily
MPSKKKYPPLKAVFFDAGNTLFRPYPSVGKVYARIALRHGVRVGADWIQGRFAEEWKKRNGLAQLKDEKHEKWWWKNLVRHVFGKTFSSETDFTAYYEELYHEFAMPHTWRLFADAIPTLKAFRKRGLAVGIVSNWDSRLFTLCDGLGVTPHVDFILASAVEGTVKPEREIFRRALRKSGVKPGEALHVGDSFREDYWGATRAGLQARLLCRDGVRKTEAACIASLAHLRSETEAS